MLHWLYGEFTSISYNPLEYFLGAVLIAWHSFAGEVHSDSKPGKGDYSYNTERHGEAGRNSRYI